MDPNDFKMEGDALERLVECGVHWSARLCRGKSMGRWCAQPERKMMGNKSYYC